MNLSFYTIWFQMQFIFLLDNTYLPETDLFFLGRFSLSLSYDFSWLFCWRINWSI